MGAVTPRGHQAGGDVVGCLPRRPRQDEASPWRLGQTADVNRHAFHDAGSGRKTTKRIVCGNASAAGM